MTNSQENRIKMIKTQFFREIFLCKSKKPAEAMSIFLIFITNEEKFVARFPNCFKCSIRISRSQGIQRQTVGADILRSNLSDHLVKLKGGQQ